MRCRVVKQGHQDSVDILGSRERNAKRIGSLSNRSHVRGRINLQPLVARLKPNASRPLPFEVAVSSEHFFQHSQALWK